MINNTVKQLLICPTTKDDLSFHKDHYLNSNIKYPLIEGIPWLCKYPDKSFLAWIGKIQQFEKEERLQQDYLDSLISKSKSEITKQRLNKILVAKKGNLKSMLSILQDFSFNKSVPGDLSTQQIHSYFELIFRDWIWGEQEVNTYFDYIKKNISKEGEKNILILGAGACKLSYKLAKEYKNHQFISTDHNPLLMLTAKKIFEGDKVDLWDYDHYPIDLENTAIRYEIKSSPLVNKNHEFILTSFPDLPFKEKSFDVIIAPWFLDILDLSFEKALNHSLRFLKDNGEYIFIGPCNVHKKDLEKRLCSDEMNNYLKNSFKSYESQMEDILYLNNPIKSQKRKERILLSKGQKPIIDENLKIEQETPTLRMTPELQQYKMVNETYHHILKNVTEDITADDLAIIIHKEFNFGPEECLKYADHLIKKINHDIS